MGKTPVQDRSRLRVESMLDAFGQLLDVVGFDEVTTTMVARQSGSAVGSVYQFFRNKAELADALRDRYANVIVEGTKTRLDKMLADVTAGQRDAITAVDCFTCLHQSMERVHRHSPGATHLPVKATQVAEELTQVFGPYCFKEYETLYSYVLVATASAAACTKAALADSTHGSDIMGLSLWSIQEMVKDI